MFRLDSEREYLFPALRQQHSEVAPSTGIDSPYEPPEAPELRIVNDGIQPHEAAGQVIRYLQTNGYLER